MGKLFPAFLRKKRDKLSHFLLLLLHSKQIRNGRRTRVPNFTSLRYFRRAFDLNLRHLSNLQILRKFCKFEKISFK